MSDTLAVPTDPPRNRRQQRRLDSIEEILTLAVEQMGEEGVAALSLSTVARRMGIRPPSLYQYFPSKLAVYDALFAQGYTWLLAEVVAVMDTTDDAIEQMQGSSAVMARWTQAHRVHAQLMFWRPVPGFEPSPESFAPAQEMLALTTTRLEGAVASGLLVPEAATPEGLALYTSLIGGVISQQLANEPDAPVGEGRFARAMPAAVDMFVQYFTPPSKRKARR